MVDMNTKRPVGRPRLDGKPAGTVPCNKKKGMKNGGSREGSGRPKGSKNINSLASVKKLEELGFDPIVEMVNQFHAIDDALASGDIRIGSGAYAQLIATKGQLINNLMQYGYKKIPDKLEQEITEKRPVSIVLTDSSTNKENKNE
jgi:hypothetical protein